MINAFGIEHGDDISKGISALVARNAKDIILPASIGSAGISAGAVMGHNKVQGTKKDDAKRAAGYGLAAGAGSTAGHFAYRGVGLAIRAKGVAAERTLPPGMSRSQRTKIERDHRKSFGLEQGDKAGMKSKPDYFRTYPKTLPGWKYKRALGAISGGREHAVGAAASALPVAAVMLHARSKDNVKKNEGQMSIAERVKDRIMKCATDDEARLYVAAVVGGVLADDVATHEKLLQHHLDQVISKRTADVSKAIKKAYISKSLAGEPVEHLVQAAVELAKADEEYKRDDHGRFATVDTRHHRAKITYQSHRTQPMHPKAAEINFGVKGGDKLSGQDLANYQQAYMQVAQSLRPFGDTLSNDAALHLTYQKGNESPFTKTVAMPHDTKDLSSTLSQQDFKDGSKLLEVGVTVAPGLTSRGAAFDLFSALGTPAGITAARAVGTNEKGDYDGATRLNSFAADWNSNKDGEGRGNRGGLFRRLTSGSRLLNSVLSPFAPEGSRLKLALDAADFVGQYGAEAEKVVGPHADRTAYRYRGVEKTPSPVLQQSINAVRSRYPDTAAGADSARNELIYGTTSDHVGRNGRIHVEQRPSPLVSYLKGKLAKPELLNLQSKSGVIPPSQGIIVDRKGKVVTEAVGYGEDWYLPFNLKTLSQVQGGEYVRTRAWGGPTTEDIYAGLVSGARAVTVVSHSGTFTIEFDDSFRGSRRYNDKAARMVKRYGHLLDAVKSKQVTLSSVPQDRMDELRAIANTRANPEYSPKQNQAELDKLELAEREKPQMSSERKAGLANEFLDNFALDHPSSDGTPTDWAQMAGQYVDNQVARQKALSNPYEDFDEGGARADAAARVRTATQLIDVLEQKPAFDKFMAAKQAEYEAEQSPLNLNGAGYDKAMQALQEQFPYYISSAQWTPERPHQVDTGYIKPNYTRPAAALAGYYDHSIEGATGYKTMSGKPTGKIEADKTRWQNGKDPGNYKGKEATQDDETPAPGRAWDRPDRATSPEARALVDQDSVMALYDHISKQPTITGPNGSQSMSTYMADPKASESIRKALPTAFGMSRTEFADRYNSDPSGAKKDLVKDANELNRLGYFKLDQSLIDAVEDPEKAKRGREYNLGNAVGNPDAEYNLGPDYARGQPSSVYAMRARAAMNQLGVPADTKLDDPKLNDILTAMVKKDHAEIVYAGRGHAGSPNVDVPRHTANVRTAVEAKQLLRRHKEALEEEANEKARAAAAPATPPPFDSVVHINASDMAPEDLKRFGFQGSTPATPNTKDPSTFDWHSPSAYGPGLKG